MSAAVAGILRQTNEILGRTLTINKLALDFGGISIPDNSSNFNYDLRIYSYGGEIVMDVKFIENVEGLTFEDSIKGSNFSISSSNLLAQAMKNCKNNIGVEGGVKWFGFECVNGIRFDFELKESQLAISTSGIPSDISIGINGVAFRLVLIPISA